MDKDRKPADDDLAVLGDRLVDWRNLVALIVGDFEGTTSEWVYSGKNHGWALRLKRKDRAIVYLAPGHGEFRASLALGERAVAAARDSDLPQSVVNAIDQAPKYAEGRGVRIVVEGSEDVQSVVRLARIKMDH